MSGSSDQHWVVVGCSRRLGLFITERFLSEGAYVTGLYRDLSEPLSRLKVSHTENLSLHAFDLTKTSSNSSELLAFLENKKPITGVIHLASQFFPTPLNSVSSSDWDILFETNVKGHFFLDKLLIPFLAHSSVIIHLVDIYATKPLRNYYAYSAAKGALLTTMKNLAQDLAPKTRVNAISPGSVLLPESFQTEEIQKHQENTLLKRLGSPEDIWNAVKFIAANQYLTGINLKVDGGTSLC